MAGWFCNGIYLAVYLLLTPWIVYRRRAAGRPLGNWRQRVLGLVPKRESNRLCMWIHAVSVGEVNQLGMLLPALQQQFPNWEFVISTTTATGQQLARKKFPRLTTFYFPIDFSWAVHRAFRRVRPSLLLLTELEIWPNLIRQSDQQNIPVAIVNGRLSHSSFTRYRRARRILKSTFAGLNLVTAQNQDYANRFIELGCPAKRVHVTGSIKFDAQPPRPNRQTVTALMRGAGLRPDDVVWVAGSTQDPEEQIVAQVYRSLKPRFPMLRLVLVPRHPHRASQVASMLEQTQLTVVRRSEFGLQPADRDRVVLVDTIGELNDWWNIAAMAFVGGSLGRRGGQNMIEPALAGKPMCFGPNTWNFADVVELLRQADAATVVVDRQELEKFVVDCLADPDAARVRGRRAQQLVVSQRGATQRIVRHLQQLVSSQSRSAKHRAA